MFTQEDALKIVACLRSCVEDRLYDLKAAQDTDSNMWETCTMCFRVLHVAEDHPLVVIYDTRISEQDVCDRFNYDLLKSYVPNLLVGVTLPNPQLITCKDHRVRA